MYSISYTRLRHSMSFTVMLKLVEQAPTFLNAFHPYSDILVIHLFQHKSVIKMSQNQNQKVPKLRSESWSTSSCAGHNSLIISCSRVTLHVSKIVTVTAVQASKVAQIQKPHLGP